MSSSHERQLLHHPPAPVPEPRRRTTHHQNGNVRTFPTVREIHKNAWLKRLSAPEKKGTSFIKKYEKHWVVFCVHDDLEALLEFYSEPKMGAAHKPLSTVCLNTCLHVSPSIIGQDNEYEFVITLPNQVLRLIAANWEQMIEWVESLQGKLREMNILSPKDNVYSKLPENHGYNSHSSVVSRSAIITTRDPNSPLPPPPSITVSPVPGIEVVHSSLNSGRNRDFQGNDSEEASRLTSVAPAIGANQHHRSTDRSSANGYRDASTVASTSIVEPVTSVVHVDPSTSTATAHTVEIVPIIAGAEEVESIEVPSGIDLAQGATKSVVVVNGGAVTSNTSVVQVTCGVQNHAVTSVHLDSSIPESRVNASSLTPSESSAPPLISSVRSLSADSATPSVDTSCNPNSQDGNIESDVPLSRRKQNSGLSQMQRSSSSENVYEHLFISPCFAKVSSTPKPPPIVHRNGESSRGFQTDSEQFSAAPVIPRRSRHHRNACGSGTGSAQRSSSLGRLDQNAESSRSNDCRFTNGPNNRSQLNSSHHQGGKHRSRPQNSSVEYSSIAFPNAPNSNRSISSEFRPMEAMIGVRSGEYRIRRDDVPVVGTSVQVKGDLERSQSGPTVAHVPLKEQQVMRLKAEIQHPAGVRIVLRKKDCINSIAFVDYLGAVWIAGWKQQQHPVLYYAFHVGDQVVKVAGVTVQNSAEAHRAIKMVSSMQVEFVIRRLPYGQVLVLKRSRDGEPLGLVVESNSGEIGDVVPNGLAAKHGLPSHVVSADGKSSCNWFLTEINNRPLSLLAKESEVKERLNAVGKEISILVQPADLVKHLRKQLKSMKSFKDYLVV